MFVFRGWLRVWYVTIDATALGDAPIVLGKRQVLTLDIFDTKFERVGPAVGRCAIDRRR